MTPTPAEWTPEQLIRMVELLDDTLALYATDEDRFNRGQGEPYGLIPTEAGIVARAARYRVQLREAREVRAADDLRGLARALDVNARLCVAYLVWTGTYDRPVPDLSDVSLVEANAATALVERFNDENAQGARLAERGFWTIHSVVANEACRAAALAFALYGYHRAQQLVTAEAVMAGMVIPEGPSDAG